MSVEEDTVRVRRSALGAVRAIRPSPAGKPRAASSVRVRQIVEKSMRDASTPAEFEAALSGAIAKGCDAVAHAKTAKLERENTVLRRDLAEARAGEQVFRAEVRRLRERLGEVGR